MSKGLKRFTAILLAAVTALTLSACKKDDDPSPYTEKEYLVKAVSLYNEANDMFNVDISDWEQEEAVAKNREIIENARPLYKELAELQAPRKYAAKQEIIKEGSDATMKMLDIMLEMNEIYMDENLPEAEKQKKIEEVTKQSDELVDVMSEFYDIMVKYKKDAAKKK